ncbi:DNA-binding domain-containing protein [Pseudomonas akapageensis]|uniref:HvfC family RiPP maturation protein n=1 Tax=Pseudomonas akapageensis TaxID=2609961 RepID=UPI00140D3B8A|nr:putative DNA-binding domain-containing protein [Pseudomonas akapageensis]
MSGSKTLLDQQLALTGYLRDPDNRQPPEGMDVARVEVYRELVMENLVSLLSSTFPVLIGVLGDKAWRELVRAFLRDHRAATPKFGEVAQEFVAFLSAWEPLQADGAWPAFTVELAHYEWIEMALQQSEAAPLPESAADLLLERPLRISALAWPLAYTWPVHRLGLDYQPVAAPAQPTLLLIRRGADWRVRFSELSPLAFRLLQRIEEFAQLNGQEQLLGLAEEVGNQAPDGFIRSGLALLQQMHAEGVIGVAEAAA